MGGFEITECDLKRQGWSTLCAVRLYGTRRTDARASILNSETADEVGIVIVRTFVQLREMLSANKELAAMLIELERKVASHDQAITGLINTIRQLMKTPEVSSRPIGFTADIRNKKAS